MSHELRTPLHAILSYSHYGEKKYESADRDDLLHYFNQISKSANRLFPLIDSLLDLSKLEAGKMDYDLSHDDIRNEILQIFSELQPLALDKVITFKMKNNCVTPMACFDKHRIAQVIRNLLTNAIKFGEQGSIITVQFSESDSEPRELKTTISNRGVRIPESELTSIFDKFVKSTKTKTGAGETGLGLSICKKLYMITMVRYGQKMEKIQ